MCSPKQERRADHRNRLEAVVEDRRDLDRRRVEIRSSLRPRAPMLSFELSGQ
jgi:hypothetical protein